MSFLKRVIRDGIKKGIGDAIGKAVQQAVEPTATKLANQTAESLDQFTGQKQHSLQQVSGWEGAMGNLQRSVEGYATEMAKNVKLCPNCGEVATSDMDFCPHCGTKLPELSVAQGAVCTSCGKQNTVGMKFCFACGAKLPAAIQQEAEEIARGEAILARWDSVLAVYPKWNCGGIPVEIECVDDGVYYFTVDFHGDAVAARRAVKDYLILAQQHGFHPAGMYPSQENLYNRIHGVCYYLDTEHAFDGDNACPVIAFAIREPEGGYDYIKPEPKKTTSLFDFFQ